MSKAVLVNVVNCFDDLSKKSSFSNNVRFLLDEVVKKVSLGCMLEDEDVLRLFLRKLLILLITHEGHVLAVLEGADDVGMAQRLESQKLVFEVPLLLGTAGGHHLKHEPIFLRSIGVYAGIP